MGCSERVHLGDVEIVQRADVLTRSGNEKENNADQAGDGAQHWREDTCESCGLPHRGVVEGM